MDIKNLKSGDFTFSAFVLRVILICFSSTGCTNSVMFMQIFRIRATRQNFRQALQRTWVLHLPYPTHCFSFWTHYSATSKLMLNAAYMFSVVVQNYLMEQHVFFFFLSEFHSKLEWLVHSHASSFYLCWPQSLWKWTQILVSIWLCIPFHMFYGGESNENLKSVLKIRNTAWLSCKLATVILMVWRVADRWQYIGGTQHDGAAIV